jgi:hypothetical protein
MYASVKDLTHDFTAFQIVLKWFPLKYRMIAESPLLAFEEPISAHRCENYQKLLWGYAEA